MKRKEFIKKSSTLVAGGYLTTTMIACQQSANTQRTNWAGNYSYAAPDFYEPESVDQMRELVANAKNVKALGSTHCFNNIADSDSSQISTRHLNRVVAILEEQQKVIIEAGIRYGELAPVLNRAGLALHNLASLPHISVAGACATATHGSGVRNGNLATAVTALEMVTANGDVVTLTKDDADFHGAVVNLGALGIVTQITLEVQPSFQVRQFVFQNMPLQSVTENFDDIVSRGYSVSLFTDWQNKRVSQVWVKQREDETPLAGDDFFGATPASRNLHPITELSAENCSAQMGVEGPWYEHLPHFKMGFTPSSGEELQSEYFIARENAVDAILAIEALKERIHPHLYISEIRTIARDDLWLSPCYQRDSVAIHFTWKPHGKEVNSLLPVIESELAPYDVRPHWGKLFTIAPAALRARYEKMSDFVTLAVKYDPEGRFKNEFLELNIFGTT